MLNKEQLERYAELKIQEKLIKNELEFLAPEIITQVTEFIDQNEGALPGIEGKGKFSITKKKTWTYSDFVKNSEAAIKERKKEEEASGEAIFEEKEILMFKQETI